MGTTLRFTSQKESRRPLLGPRGVVVPFQPGADRLPRPERLKRLGRAGLAWIGLWAALLAGSAMAVFMTNAAPESEIDVRPSGPGGAAESGASNAEGGAGTASPR